MSMCVMNTSLRSVSLLIMMQAAMGFKKTTKSPEGSVNECLSNVSTAHDGITHLTCLPIYLYCTVVKYHLP